MTRIIIQDLLFFVDLVVTNNNFKYIVEQKTASKFHLAVTCFTMPFWFFS